MKGFFAIGIHNAKNETNVGTLWRTANLFGAAFIFTVGRRYRKQASDTMKTPRDIPLFHFADVDALHAHLPHACRLIGVELTDTAKPSHLHGHAEQCCYLLGSEDNGLPAYALDRCHAVIKLPGTRSMNVAVAGGLVLYDRWQQREASVPVRPELIERMARVPA